MQHNCRDDKKLQFGKFSLVVCFFFFSHPITGMAPRALRAKLAGRPPNLLIITSDTTRADFLHCYGHPLIKTRAIDRLAKEGVFFSRAYAQAPQTLPSHTSLFTGLYPITHNVFSNGQDLDDEALTLAEVLKQKGYVTGAIIGASPLHQDFNLDQGFDSYNDDFRDPLLSRGFKSFFRFFSRGKINIATSRPANRVAALAKKWLSKHAKRNHPFFLWVHFFDPHHPYIAHPDFKRPNVAREDGKANEYGVKESNYLSEIEFADYYLGQVLNHLDRLGLTENTLTVFTADHGESLGEHSYRGHREELYDSIVRVPLIIRFPGRLPMNETFSTPAMTIDITPTVLSLLGIPFPKDVYQGVNLFSLPEDRTRKIFSMAVELFTKSPIRVALIVDDWKFIQFDDPERNALYNLETDPEELQNILHKRHSAYESAINWEAEVKDWFERFEKLEIADIPPSQEQIERLRSLGYVH